MIRDSEIKRLILYAKALDVKVNIRNYSFDHPAEFIEDVKWTININKKKHTSKTAIIMSLLHELSHVRYLILTGDNDSEAWQLEEDRLENKRKSVPKKLRYDIMKFETESLKLMPIIAKELKLKVTESKVLENMAFDQFVYRYYYKFGVYPKNKILDKKRKKLRKKYS